MVVDACANPQEWWAGWQALSAIGIILSGFVISLAYMFGATTSNEPLKARAKNELFQVLATLFMLALVVGFVAGTCALDLSSVGIVGGGNIYQVGERYIEWLSSRCLYVLGYMLESAYWLGLFTSIGMGLPFTISIGAYPFSGFATITNSIQMLISTQLIMTTVAAAQFALYQFVAAGMLPILFPVGVVCRCFPFTREFGGALMAISIGFFLFYPFFFALDWILVGQPSSARPNISVEFDFFGMLESMIEWIVYGLIVEIIQRAMQEDILNILGVLLFPVILLVQYILFLTIGMIIMINAALLDWLTQVALLPLGEIMMAGLFLPALNGILMVSVVRDLSRMLGEEVDITTLTRMI